MSWECSGTSYGGVVIQVQCEQVVEEVEPEGGECGIECVGGVLLPIIGGIIYCVENVRDCLPGGGPDWPDWPDDDAGDDEDDEDDDDDDDDVDDDDEGKLPHPERGPKYHIPLEQIPLTRCFEACGQAYRSGRKICAEEFGKGGVGTVVNLSDCLEFYRIELRRCYDDCRDVYGGISRSYP